MNEVRDYLIDIEKDVLTVEEMIWLTHPCKSRDQFSNETSYGKEPKKHIINTESIFLNNNPVQIEIGCGKGQFIIQTAAKNPNTNYIAVEINESVIVQACERAKKCGLKNLRFLLVAAEKLPIYIEENSIDRIYLNFSTPFPKNNHAKHRLTHENYLNVYRSILKKNGEIFQKTDNMNLFEFSIEEFSKCGFVLSNISLDLHNSNYKENIITEYEQKFINAGKPIYRLEARVN